MFKNALAIFFLTVFMAFITAPTVISVIDDSIDVSCFYTINEEEETVSHVKSVKGFISNSDYLSAQLCQNASLQYAVYRLKVYQKPFLNRVIPPPEFI